MSIYNSFQDSFNGALRGGALLQGILHNSEEREFRNQVKRADEFARGLDGLTNNYGSSNPKDWDDAGRQQLNDLLNEYPDLTGTRPGGKATYNSIVPTGDGVAAVVTVNDGKGGGSTGPITARGSTDDDDEVVILTDVNEHLKAPIVDNLRLQRAKMAARVNSPTAHKMISEGENQENKKDALETLYAAGQGGAAAPESPVEAPATPDAPAPAIEDGPAQGLQSAAVGNGAVTSPARGITNFEAEPAQAAGRQYTGPALQPELTDAIGKHAETRGLDPALIQAVVHAESSGNAGAFNDKASATGLMQMTPIGLKEFNIQYGKNYTMEDMKDPEKNLEAGTGLLKYYLDKQGGNEQQALAAYNGGITRLRKNGGDISKMPPETRDYVGKIIGMVSGSGEAQAAEAPSAEPRGLDTAALEPSTKPPRAQGRGRGRNNTTPVDVIDNKIAEAEARRDRLSSTKAKRSRGGANKVSALDSANKRIDRMKAERAELVRDPKAEKAAAEAVAAQQATEHEKQVDSFIASFTPRSDAQKKVVEELKGTPGPASQAEAVAAADTVKATKPAKKWTEDQRKALYTLHRLNPTQFPLKDVVTALETGRVTQKQWKTFQNGVGQTIRVDEDGTQTVLGNTPENQAHIDARLSKAQYDANISRVEDQRSLQEGQLAQTKSRTDFMLDQAVNIHGDEPQRKAALRDKINTTTQTMGLNLDDQATPTAINRAARVDQLFNESQGATWYKPWTWLDDAGYTHDLSFAMAVQNVPNSPYDAASPDDGEVVKAAEYYKTEYLDPILEDFPGLGKQKQVQASYMATHLEKRGMSRKDAIRVSGSVVGHSRFKTVGEAIALADQKIAQR